jgi:hypothetical protein
MDFTYAEIILFVGFTISSIYVGYLRHELYRQKEMNIVITESNRAFFTMYCSANTHANKCLDFYKESNDNLIKAKIEISQLKSNTDANISAKT